MTSVQRLVCSACPPGSTDFVMLVSYDPRLKWGCWSGCDRVTSRCVVTGHGLGNILESIYWGFVVCVVDMDGCGCLLYSTF